MRRVTQPPEYRTGTWAQASSAIASANTAVNQSSRRATEPGTDYLKKHPPDLLFDLAALDQGGTLKTSEELDKMLDAAGPDVMEWQRSAIEVLKHADPSLAPGSTPLVRAASYLMLLERTTSQSQGVGRTGGSRGTYQGEDGEELITGLPGEGVAGRKTQDLNEALEKAHDAMRRGDIEVPGGKGKGRGDLTNWDDAILVAAAQEMLMGVLTAIERAGRVLDTHAETTAQPEIKFREDPDGNIVSSRTIQGPHEVPMMSPAHKAMLVQNPAYGVYNVVQGQATVIPRGTLHTRKQFTVIAVDTSGSMRSMELQIAWAIAWNRVAYAQKGQAVVLLYTFNSMAGSPLRIDENRIISRADVVLELKRAGNPFGGGTDIAVALEKGRQVIQSTYDGDEHVAPELILITDGGSEECRFMTDPSFYKLKDGTPWKLTYIPIMGNGGPGVSSGYEDYAKAVRTMRAGHTPPYTGYPATHFALCVASIASGGAMYAIDATDGRPVPLDVLFRGGGASVSHNPYARAGFTQGGEIWTT